MRIALAEPCTASLVGISAGTGALFVVLAGAVLVGLDPLVAFDERWSSRAYSFMSANGWCETLARAATWLGNGQTVAVVTGLVAIACAVGRRLLLMVWLAVTVAGSSFVNIVLKYGMERVRPATAGVVASAHGFAFPSGHAQAATVTYPAIALVVGWQVWRPGRWIRRISFALVSLIVAAVGLSRIFLGVHWPTDVVGGWLLGSAWLTAATAALLGRAARLDESHRGQTGAQSQAD